MRKMKESINNFFEAIATKVFYYKKVYRSEPENKTKTYNY